MLVATLSFALGLAWASPALVTTVRGEVGYADGQATQPVPFLLAEGQALQLGEGATVVVLYEGAATQVQGPARVDVSRLAGASAGTGGQTAALDELLSRGSSLSSVGATRGGSVQLQRPIPGTTVGSLEEIRWSCAACGEQTVEVYSFMDDLVVWTGKGTGSVTYAGPALAAGPYTIKLSGEEVAFQVAAKGDLERVKASVGVPGVEGLDPAARTALTAGLYVQAGMPTDALYALDKALALRPSDPELEALRASLEERVGLR